MSNEINLLPEKYRDLKRKKRKKGVQLAVSLLIVLLIPGIIYAPLHMLRAMKNKSITVENEIINMKDITNYRKIDAELKKDIERREKLVDFLTSRRQLWSEIISEVAGKVPEGVSLLCIDYSDDGSLEVQGQALSYNLVSQFMVNVQNIDVVSGMMPVSIVQKDNGLYVFVVKFDMVSGSDGNEAE